MSEPQQVDEQPVDAVKTDSVGTDQQVQKVMPSAKPEGSARQEVPDSSDDEEEYTMFNWSRGKGHLRGYYYDRAKPTSTQHNQGTSVQSASLAEANASLDAATDGGSQTATTGIDSSRADPES